MSAVDDTERALVAAIEAAPDDDEPRMVYADWLMERGDPRGELSRVQLERNRDPWWSRDRLNLRERRFMPPAVGGLTPLFDRGEAGFAFEVLDHPNSTPRARWAQPHLGQRWAYDHLVARAVEAFRASKLMRRVYRLDLSHWTTDTWTQLLDASARPRHVVLPPGAGVHAAALRDAPLLAQVERLELGGTCDDAALETLLAAPWARNLVHLSLSTRGRGDRDAADGPWQRAITAISDDGLATLAATYLPRLRSLDARLHPITARGIAALASSSLQLASLQLSIDDLGCDGIAALDRSRLAGITRVSLAGPWLSSVDAVAALVRSPCWDGGLDLRHLRHQGDVAPDAAAGDLLDVLTPLDDARPLTALAVGYARGLDAFLHTPIARPLQHLRVVCLPNLGTAAIRLDSLRVTWADRRLTSAALAAPALGQLRRLSLRAGHVAHAMDLLADSPLRVLDLEIRGTATTGTTVQLIESPALERVVDLTLSLDGNHASKLVGAALVDTPYLQEVQRLELPFVALFPPKAQAAIAGRYGRAVDWSRGL